MRKTKIVCTLGPRSSGPETLRALIRAGMNVVRLNFSHGDHATHRAVFEAVHRIAAEERVHIGVLADLQGPKIRTGRLEGHEPVSLVEGATLRIVVRDEPGSAERIAIPYPPLIDAAEVGGRLLLADGEMELRVDRMAGDELACTVIRGGLLGENKGVNLPGSTIQAPSLTEDDQRDLAFALELGVDFVALSFVRSAADVEQLKAILRGHGSSALAIAKIERPEAVDSFDAILAAADGIMLARGDLGVEVPLEDVPQIQKNLIHQCNDRGVPVITATQMLESMIHNKRPTRAEVADVANAIYDGTDAVMLSGETAIGRFPVDAVRVMANVAAKAEAALAASPPREVMVRLRASSIRPDSFDDAIGQAVSRMADALHVQCVACFTRTGYTARVVSRYRPAPPIAAITLSPDTARRCALLWGVTPYVTDIARYDSGQLNNTRYMAASADSILSEDGRVQTGDTLVIMASTPKAAGRTDVLLLHRVGESVL